MDMDKLPLEEATDEQIRAFARTILQLEGADAKAIKQVRADVAAAWPQSFIWTAKAPTALQVVGGTDSQPPMPKSEIEKLAGAGIAASSSKGDPTVLLIIAKTDQPGGKDPVFLNVNGNAMHVARGINQKVPYRYFEDLKCTIQRLHEWDEKTGVVTHEEVARFPMQVLQMPSDDDIFEFHRLDAARSGQTLTREHFDAVKASREAAKLRESVDSERARARGTAA